MLESIKKVLYAGIGIFAISEDKAKEIIAELIKQGEITAQEGDKLLNEIKEKAYQKGRSFEESFAMKIKDYLKISELEKRVEQLEKEVGELRQKLS